MRNSEQALHGAIVVGTAVAQAFAEPETEDGRALLGLDVAATTLLVFLRGVARRPNERGIPRTTRSTSLRSWALSALLALLIMLSIGAWANPAWRSEYVVRIGISLSSYAIKIVLLSDILGVGIKREPQVVFLDVQRAAEEYQKRILRVEAP